ncbi:MAG: hypothetical protein HY908_25115 [Myxococcales bacterium]|nr:hypothetical protein [Myxococcales bacterium]
MHRHGWWQWVAGLAGLAVVGASALARAEDACVPEPLRRAAWDCADGSAGTGPAPRPSLPVSAAPEPKAAPRPGRPVDGPSTETRPAVLHPRDKALLLAQIAGLEGLLHDTAASASDHPKVLRQLADAYAELAAAASNEKLDAELKARAVATAQPDAARQLRDAAGKAGRVRDEARKGAVRHYASLATTHPRFCLEPAQQHGCADEALYFWAYELEQAGDRAGARDVYLRIVSDWPSSSFLPRAYLAFGEELYEAALGEPQKWRAAEQAYREVLQRAPADGALWAHAQNKLAYVHWNQGALDRAIDDFAALVVALERRPLGDPTGLAEHARRDLGAVYAAAGDVGRAFDFIAPLAGDAPGSSTRAFAWLERLGTGLVDRGRYADAIALHRELLRRNPGDRSCAYQSAVTRATLAWQSGDKDAVGAELEQQLRSWQRFDAGRHPDALRASCANDTAELLLDVATAWHLEAVGSGGVRGTGDARALAGAARWYAAVIASFGRDAFRGFTFPRLVKEDWPTLAKVRYWQADLAYAQKDWKTCGPAFDAAYAEDPSGRDASAASFGSAVCHQKALDTERGRGVAATPSEGERAPRELGVEERATVGAFQRYLCRFAPTAGDPESAERHVEVAFALGRTFYDARHFAEAAEVFGAILRDHAGAEAAPYAANYHLAALHALALAEGATLGPCTAALERAAGPLYASYCEGERPRGDGASCALLHRTYVDLLRLGAERRVRSCDAGGAGALAACEAGGDAYFELWKTHLREPCEKQEPLCALADEVLYDAARAYQAARLVGRAIGVRTLLLDPRYHLDGGAVARRATYEIGAAYQAIAVYDEAARWYERYAADDPAGERAPDALADAVVLRLGLGEPAAAVASARLFERRFGSKDGARAAQLALAIAAHYAEKSAFAEAERELASALPTLDARASEDLRIQAHALMARIARARGKGAVADAEYDKVRSAWRDPEAVASRLAALGGSEEEQARRLTRVLTAVGEALVAAAEQKRRVADALPIPVYRGAGSARDVDAFVRTKVKVWMEKKELAIREAEGAYLAVKALRPAAPPRWVVVAAEASGGLWARYVAEILRAPYPRDWDRPGYVPDVDPPLLWAELKATFQNELARSATPQRERARRAYEVCLATSAAEQFFDEHTRACERWLSQEYPNEYHLVDELRPAASRSNTGLDERSAMLDAQGEPLFDERRR